MVNAKELLCVVVDVSPTMHPDLPAIAASLTELLHKSVLWSSNAGAVKVALQLSGSNCAAPPVAAGA